MENSAKNKRLSPRLQIRKYAVLARFVLSYRPIKSCTISVSSGKLVANAADSYYADGVQFFYGMDLTSFYGSAAGFDRCL